MAPEHVEHDPDAALEPVSLIRQSGVIIRTGRMMLAAGTASYRVKEAMQAVARSLGISRHSAHVTLTEITATTHRGDIFRTEVTEVRQITVNADRIAALDRVKRELEPGETVQAINERLDKVDRRGALYPAAANAMFAGAACAAFAVLNNARLWEVIAVFFAATAGQFVRRSLAHASFNHFAQTMVAATVACLSYLGGVTVINMMPWADASQTAGYISATLFLVPGFALVTAALDLTKLDFSAGIARMSFALMIVVGAALGIWAVSLGFGIDPDVGAPFTLSVGTEIALRAAASAVGVLGFALMFNSPIRMAATAASIGMVANVARLAMVDHGMVIQAATVIACATVGILAALASPLIKSPIITLSVPATLIMIPGVGIYRTLVSLNEGFTVEALASGTEAAFVMLSIVVGLVIAKLVTDKEWAFERR